MTKIKKRELRKWEEVIASQRRDWGNVNPVTKIIPDKRNKKPKHKSRSWGLDEC